MHRFSHLVFLAVNSNLRFIRVAQIEIYKKLEASARTGFVKALQSLRLQRVILAVGVFSIFEAHAQKQLDSTYTFEKIKKQLEKLGARELKKQFQLYQWAINTLKHGSGDSYDKLCEWTEHLPFKIKKKPTDFFYEGDVSEPEVLIEVDDQFVLNCAHLIHDISDKLKIQ